MKVIKIGTKHMYTEPHYVKLFFMSLIYSQVVWHIDNDVFMDDSS